MKTKKNSEKKGIYSQVFSYISESKNYLLLVVAIFLWLFVMGFALNAPAEIVLRIKEIVKQLLEQTKGLGGIELIFFIFRNNFLVSFMGLFLGIFLGIAPFFITISNGYVLGYICKVVFEANGGLVLLRLLPHGIFELPAIIISLGLGMRLGMSFFKKDKPISEFIRRLKLSFKVFIFLIVPLLIIAAIIEGILIGLVG